MNSENSDYSMKPVFDPCRLTGRLFYLLVSLLLAFGVARAVPPLTTTISDVVYRADGSAASGTLLITWAQFNSSDNKAVAAGTMSVTIGSGGAVNLALAPNVGATPAGSFYKVTYKLDECITNDTPQLQFYSQYAPPSNTAIAVRYRSGARALARILDPAKIAANASGNDDGVRGAVRHVVLPPPRTEPDCENAALALLDDATQDAWKGSYKVWSDFLPNGPASDVWPGDALTVNVASRGASFNAIVRAVTLICDDLSGDRSQYTVTFANDAAELIAMTMNLANLAEPLDATATTTTSGNAYIPDVPAAEATSITSTTVAVDAGAAPPTGGGFEVRLSDSGWSQTEDRNLVGRFTTQTFTLTRFTRLITYYVKQYDNSSPPKYSRNATALHVDYPL